MNTVETIVVVRDSSNNVIATYSQTQPLALTVTGIDLEYEVVYNSGNPLIRPKQFPKF